MQNLEQIRAKNALEFLKNDPFNKKNSGQHGDDEQKSGDVLSGFPALIINNGLLATIAYSLDKKHGYDLVCDAIAEHLQDKHIGLLSEKYHATGAGLRDHLTGSNSTQLRLCTAEALAYLAYLKRFGKKG